MRRPETRYAIVGQERVAYQAFGDGQPDLLYLKSCLSSVDGLWDHPAELRIWRSASEAIRMVMFDHRGLGMSDSVSEDRLGDLDERVEDALAVLDHLGIARAAVLAEMDETAIGIMLAVQHPERVEKLVLMNGISRGARATDYPFGDDSDEIERTAQAVLRTWGSGKVLATVAPLLAGDLAFAGRFERMAASPRAAAAMICRFGEIDVRDLLALVAVPTLVVYTGDVTTIEVGHARYLAEHIAGATLVETSSTSWYWGGGAVDAMITFVTGAQVGGADRDLATLLFTDVVASTEAVAESGDVEWARTLDFLDDLVASRVERFQGRVVKQTGDGHLAEFSRPGDAVRAALAIVDDVAVLGVTLRVGLHTGEIERRDGGDVGGIAVHVAARVASQAAANQVLLSRTLADLVAGADFNVADQGERELKGVPGTWRLFSVEA